MSQFQTFIVHDRYLTLYYIKHGGLGGRPTWAPLQPTSHGKRLTAAQPPDTSMNDERPTMNDQALNAAMTTLRRATQPMMVNAATTKGVMKTRGLFWRIGMALKMYVKTWI